MEPVPFRRAGDTKIVNLGLLGNCARITQVQYTSPGGGGANANLWSVSNPAANGAIRLTFSGSAAIAVGTKLKITIRVSDLSAAGVCSGGASGPVDVQIVA